MRQSDQWTTAPSYMGGNASTGWRQDNGAVVTGFGNGQEVIDTGAAISRLGFTPTATSGNVAEWREMASSAHRQAQAYENAAQELITWTKTDRSGTSRSTETSSGWDSSAGRSANTSVDQFDRTTASSSQGFDERWSTGQSLTIGNGRDRSATVSDTVGGRLSAGTSGGGGGKQGLRGALPSLGLQVGSQGQQSDQLRHSTSDNRTSESQSSASSNFRDEHSSGSGASQADGTYEKAGTFSRASTTASSSMSHEEALARANSYSETARKLEELSQQLSRDASYAETHGLSLSQNLSQDLAQWYRTEQASSRGLDAPELWATVLTPHQAQVRQEMIERWMESRQEAIRAEVADRLGEPDLVHVGHPDTTDASDVAGAYRPRVPPKLPSGPDRGDPHKASELIDAGAKRSASERGSAQAVRTTNVQAASSLQSEAGENQNVGFFQDKNLRD